MVKGVTLPGFRCGSMYCLRRIRSSISSLRPTNAVVVVGSASKRLSPEHLPCRNPCEALVCSSTLAIPRRRASQGRSPPALVHAADFVLGEGRHGWRPGLLRNKVLRFRNPG
jgi:hypothetical protein